MIKKKIVLSGLLCVALGLTTVGCRQTEPSEPVVVQPEDSIEKQNPETPPTTEKDSTEENSGETDVKEPNDESTSLDDEKEKYDTLGQIVTFEENKVHIMVGDVIDIHTVDNGDEFYLGQTVGLKGTTLTEVKHHSFDKRYTTRGNEVNSIQGRLQSVSDEDIKIKTSNGLNVFSNYISVDLAKDTMITLDYIDLDGVLTVIGVHNEEWVLPLTVSDIKRGKNGLMLITAVDSKNSEYIVGVESTTLINFNYSELKVGDSITLYPTEIAESYPMQISASKITLKK